MGFLYREFQHGEETEEEDILRNLAYILESKEDSSAYFPDFGLGEPIHTSAEESMLRYAERIRAAIERYEPRVRVAEIEERHDGDRPGLDVQLELRSSGSRLSLAVDPRSRSVRWSVPDEEEP